MHPRSLTNAWVKSIILSNICFVNPYYYVNLFGCGIILLFEKMMLFGGEIDE